MKNNILLIATILASFFQVNAQDPHFTQQFDNPLYLNPAQSGNGEKLNRLVFNYRDQWRTVPAPFSTTFLSFDRNLFSDEKQRIGGGIQLLYDRGGDGHLATVQTSIAPSYTRIFKERYAFSAGLQLGVINRLIKAGNLIFENEGEKVRGSGIKLDLGVGAHLKTYFGKKKYPINVGFALHNLTKPNLSIIEESNDNRPIRLNTYATSEVFLANGWSINPVLHLQFQEKSRDILPLVYAKKLIEKKKPDLIPSLESKTNDSLNIDGAKKQRKMAFSVGGGYRIQDAIMLYGALELNDLKIGLSYDINTSGLKEASRSFGAVELLVKYEFGNKKEKPEPVITYDTLIILDTISIDELLVEEEETIIEETETEVIQEINAGLAVSMYFPNDYPNPNTRDTITDMTYAEVYEYYASLTSKHPELTAFIEEFVIPDQARFNTLVEDLIGILETGKSVSLDIRGYASSLATSDYNLNLSKRRVDAVVNDFKNNPKILEYMNNGMLQINRLPFGETEAQDDGDDDRSDLVKSVYGKKASRERRVEIESIKIE